MPEVECPIAGCNYRTADLNDSVVVEQIEIHCANHASTDFSNRPNSINQIITTTKSQMSSNPSHQPPVGSVLIDLRVSVIGLLFCVTSFLLDVVFSFVHTPWYTVVIENFGYNATYHVGLWQTCIRKTISSTKTIFDSTCISYEEYKSSEYISIGGAQAFQCLGILFIIVAIISNILKLYLWRKTVALNAFGAIHSFWAGTSFLGSARFVNDDLTRIRHITRTDFGYHLAVVSGVIALVGSCTLIAAPCWKYYRKGRQMLKQVTKPVVAIEEHPNE